jgi:hypothetical protein
MNLDLLLRALFKYLSKVNIRGVKMAVYTGKKHIIAALMGRDTDPAAKFPWIRQRTELTIFNYSRLYGRQFVSTLKARRPE